MVLEIRTRQFHPDDEPAMNDVIRRAFNNPSSNAYPLSPARFVIIAEVDGEIAGHVSVRPMLFHFNGGVARGNVLHMVATDPAHQHRGIGLKMLEAVRALNAKEAMPVSVLETPLPGFYALRGWIPLAPRERVVITREVVQRMTPCRVAVDEILDARVGELVTFHGSRCRHAHLAAVANEPYMRLLVQQFGGGGLVSFFHEISKEGTLVGLVRGERGGLINPGEPLAITITEWIMDDPSPADVMAVIASLLDFDDEFTQVEVHLPVAPTIEQVLLAAGGQRFPRGGNVDMAILPAGCGLDPATISPRYHSGFFTAHLEAMGITR